MIGFGLVLGLSVFGFLVGYRIVQTAQGAPARG